MSIYCIVVPGYPDYFVLRDRAGSRLSNELRQDCAAAVRLHGVTMKRGKPITIPCEVLWLTVDKGHKLQRQPYARYDVTPTTEAMTQDEFEVELADVLSTIPERFRPFISGQVAARSTNREEDLDFASQLVAGLRVCLHEKEPASVPIP